MIDKKTLVCAVSGWIIALVSYDCRTVIYWPTYTELTTAHCSIVNINRYKHTSGHVCSPLLHILLQHWLIYLICNMMTLYFSKLNCTFLLKDYNDIHVNIYKYVCLYVYLYINIYMISIYISICIICVCINE